MDNNPKKRPSGRNRPQFKHKGQTLAVFNLIMLIILAGLIWRQSHQKPAAPSTRANTPVSDRQASVPPAASTLDSAATPSEAAAKTSKAVYYPAGLASGYQLNNDFQILDNKVVDYTISDSKGNKYYVAEQPITAALNINAFSKSLTGAEQFSAPAGQAIIGDDNSELIAGIRTPYNSWVLISAVSPSLRPELEAIVKSLQPVSQ